MDFVDLNDPMTILYFAPIILGVLYLVVSFWGERGE
jgi:hypothetical protein